MADRLFKCQTCHVIFPGHEEHIAHHKSDFHRFNLKRKMINLQPVTLEQFNVKVAEVKQAEEKEASNKDVISCKVCKKKFGTENTYKTHINSSKHKERAAAAEQAKEERAAAREGMEVDETPKPPQEPKTENKPEPEEPVEDNRTMEEIIDEKIRTARKILLEECMFCLKKHDDLESNIVHMQQQHGFFIPDREHLKDVEGFIEYLGEKLSIGNVCLWCNERSPTFHSLRAVQNHMHTLAHCKLAYEPEDEEEYSEFYDFSSETNNELSVVESGIADSSSEYQIVFKTGVSIGHRSLQRYYKQSYKPSESRAVVLANSAGQFKIANWYRDEIQKDKLRQAHEHSVKNQRDLMNRGVQANFLWRFRKDNVTTRNSGR